MSKKSNNKKGKAKPKADRFLLDNCKPHQKPRKKTTKGNKGGRPTKPKIEQIFHTSISNIEILFKFSQAKQEPIPTIEFISWLLDEKENKLTILERYIVSILYYTGGRINELSLLKDSELIGRRLNLQSLKKHNGEIHNRTVTLPKGINEMLDILQSQGIIKEGYILNIDDTNTDNRVRKALRNLCHRISLCDIILKATKNKKKNLTPHMFRRARATQLFESKALTKDQISSFLGHKDNRSLPHYLPEVNDSFLDIVDLIDQGIIDPISGNLPISQLKALMKEAFIESMNEMKNLQSV